MIGFNFIFLKALFAKKIYFFSDQSARNSNVSLHRSPSLRSSSLARISLVSWATRRNCGPMLTTEKIGNFCLKPEIFIKLNFFWLFDLRRNSWAWWPAQRPHSDGTVWCCPAPGPTRSSASASPDPQVPRNGWNWKNPFEIKFSEISSLEIFKSKIPWKSQDYALKKYKK